MLNNNSRWIYNPQIIFKPRIILYFTNVIYKQDNCRRGVKAYTYLCSLVEGITMLTLFIRLVYGVFYSLRCMYRGGKRNQRGKNVYQLVIILYFFSSFYNITMKR